MRPLQNQTQLTDAEWRFVLGEMLQQSAAGVEKEILHDVVATRFMIAYNSLQVIYSKFSQEKLGEAWCCLDMNDRSLHTLTSSAVLETITDYQKTLFAPAANDIKRLEILTFFYDEGKKQMDIYYRHLKDKNAVFAVDELQKAPGGVVYVQPKEPLWDDVSFGEYFQIYNAVQQYQKTKQVKDLLPAVGILYGTERIKGFSEQSLLPVEVLNVVNWVSRVLGGYFPKQFPHFFARKSFHTDKKGKITISLTPKKEPTFAETFQSMLRALTKGDITKTDDVLLSPVRIAFAELDAICKENEEQN